MAKRSTGRPFASRNSFDEEIERQLGPSAKPGDFEDKDDAEMANPDLHEDEEEGKTFVPNRDDLPDDTRDNYIGAELTLQQGNEVTTARVKKRKFDGFGNAVGTSHANPILDTRMHTLEFENGAEAECSANVIAQNMWAQCDVEGNQCQLLEEEQSTTRRAMKPSHARMAMSSSTVAGTERRAPRDGSYASSGRMDQQVGNGSRT
jgi:hypothetical protein